MAFYKYEIFKSIITQLNPNFKNKTKLSFYLLFISCEFFSFSSYIKSDR